MREFLAKSMWHSTNRNELLNGSDDTVHDQHLDDMLHEIASLAAEEDRAAKTREVQDYLTEQAYILPLFEEPVVYGVQPHVHGFQPESIGRPSFYGVSLDHTQGDDQ